MLLHGKTPVSAKAHCKRDRLYAAPQRPVFLRSRLQYRPLELCRAAPSNEDWVQQGVKEQMVFEFQDDAPLATSTPSRAAWDQGGALSLKPGDAVGGGKYTIEGVLGAGSNATTYKAVTQSGRTVAIKALSLRSMRDWKQLDLFQREAQILKTLDHPGIPKYIDYFEEDSDRDRAFFIVQDAVSGKSLAEMLESGMRCTDTEAERIAREMLQVLQYLGSLRPPVVHRDIKPENIVIEGGVWGGRVYLVDFGGVQGITAANDASSFASTVVGTYGYMAPEQFRGTAQPASDLFALGATLLFLLSGQPPFGFPQERMRINWRSGFTAPSPRWAALLDGLLEPVAEDRLTAAQALQALRGSAVQRERRQAVQEPLRRSQSSLDFAPLTPREAYLQRAGRLSRKQITRQPAGSRVLVDRTESRLDVIIPPKGLFSADTLFTGAFAIAWNAFVAVWTAGALAGGGLLFALFSMPFWFAGVQLGRQALGGALMRERFAIGLNRFRLGQELALVNRGGRNEKVAEGRTADLVGARLITTMFVNDRPQTAIEIVEGVRKYRFGEGLELEEQQWLVYEINKAIEELKGAAVDYSLFPEPETPRIFRDDNSGISRELP